MAKLGGFVGVALALVAGACTQTGQGGGMAGSGAQPAALPPGMTSAQGAAYCSTLGQTYAEYVGSVGGYLGGNFRGGTGTLLSRSFSCSTGMPAA